MTSLRMILKLGQKCENKSMDKSIEKATFETPFVISQTQVVYMH